MPKTNLTWQFETADLQRFVDAVCDMEIYPGLAPSDPEYMTKMQFFKRYWRIQFVEYVKRYENARDIEIAKSGITPRTPIDVLDQ